MMNAKLLGTGRYIPSKKVSNDDFLKIMNWNQIDSSWIEQRSGIQNRYWVDKELGSDMAFFAAEKALKKSNLSFKDIDAFIYVQLTPEMEFPSGAFVFQGKTNTTKPVFDVRAQCGGFIYALTMANAFIKSEQYKNVMIVASEVHSVFIDKEYNDISKNVSVLFGDGAGAIILGSTKENKGILKVDSFADGSHIDYLSCQKSSFFGQADSLKVTESIRYQKDLPLKYPYPYMNGKEIFKNAVLRFEEMNTSLPGSIGLDWQKDIDHYLFHQANLRIIEFVGKKLALPNDKVPTNVQKYGNLSGATLPVLLDEEIEKNNIKNDQVILLSAFGAGLVWGGAILKI